MLVAEAACVPRRALGPRRRHPLRPLAAVPERAALEPFEVRIPAHYGFDLAYVRWRREQAYVYRLHSTLQWAGLYESEGVDDRLLLASKSVHPARWATSYLARRAALERRFDDEWTMPLWMRTHERKERHRVSHLIPGHCLESTSVDRRGVSRRYVPFPHWWKSVEVAWNMRAELPAVIAYLSRLLIQNPDHAAWRIVRTEWALSVAKDLLFQARDGRLYWISPELREDMFTIGIGNLFAESDQSVRNDFTVLLRFIDALRWSLCPEENLVSNPEVAGPSPVFWTEDYFPFNTEEWTVNVPEEMLIPLLVLGFVSSCVVPGESFRSEDG